MILCPHSVEFPMVCYDQITKCLRNIHENQHLLSPNLFHSVVLVLEEARFDSRAVKKLTSLRWVNSEQSEVSHCKTSSLLIFSRHFVRCSSLLVWSCLEGHEELSKWWLNLTKWLPPLTCDIMFSPASLFSLGLSPIASSFLFVVLFHCFPFSLSLSLSTILSVISISHSSSQLLPPSSAYSLCVINSVSLELTTSWYCQLALMVLFCLRWPWVKRRVSLCPLSKASKRKF